MRGGLRGAGLGEPGACGAPPSPPGRGREPGTAQAPAEKGKKAACLTKWPWASRKCSGWKQKGFFHTVSSFSTDDRLMISGVAWQEMPDMGGV